jgi:hypothetical protein
MVDPTPKAYLEPAHNMDAALSTIYGIIEESAVGRGHLAIFRF